MKTKEQMRTYKREWARKKTNTTIKSLSSSTTWKGRRAEIIALQLLDGSTDNNSGALNKDFDILWNNQRVDVKCCNIYRRPNKNGIPIENKEKSSGWWVFNKNKGNSDLYFCICMIQNIPVRYYLIPKEQFNGGITIGQKSLKFDKYLFAKTI